MNNTSNSSFRLKRFSHFLDLLDDIETQDRPLKILDIGGEQDYWLDKLSLIDRPFEITLVNLWPAQDLRPGFVSAVGNACSMSNYADNSFDIVHSNSVIEHVGRWKDMVAMAKEVRRLARSYFVQTPYFWFPIEPHFRSVGFHWLPESVRVRRIMSRTHGFVLRAPTLDIAMEAVEGSRLLDKSMFAALFPDSTIIPEKIFGLCKSLIAVRKANRTLIQ